MSSEVDSTFYTALRLLHSRSKSSTEQLKAMLDEALAQKQSINASRSPSSAKQEKKTIPEVVSKIDKRPFEKIKLEPVEHSETKKMRLNSPQPMRSLSSSPDSQNKSAKPSPPPPMEDLKDIVKTEPDSDATDIDEEDDTDTGEFSVEMGLACVVCKHLDATPSNQAVECQECHNLYHQECHKPPITDKDISDPRVVWYCSKCTKSLKKLSSKAKGNSNSKSPTTTSAAFATTVSNAREAAFQLMKAAKAENTTNSNPATVIQPFKRAEPKISSTSPAAQGSSTKPAIGLAGFAANLNRGSASLTPMSLSASSLNTPSSLASATSPSITSIAKSADKRLQEMKKKAAKGNEKKKFKPK